MGRFFVAFLKIHLWKFVTAYLVLLAVMAYLGNWTPDYLQGRDLWHFMISRMVVAGVMLGVLAAFMRLVPAALLLAAALLFIGTISAIKREATGEPFQVSDLFLARQGSALFGYVSWQNWLIAAAIVPALFLGSEEFASSASGAFPSAGSAWPCCRPIASSRWSTGFTIIPIGSALRT